MIPMRIANANLRLGAPKNWDEKTHGKCVEMSVRQEEGGVFATAWELLPRELELLNNGGSVVLRVVGGQPPVNLTVEPAPPLVEQPKDYHESDR